MQKFCGLAIAAMLAAGFTPASAQQAAAEPGTEPGTGYNAPGNQQGANPGQQQQPGNSGSMEQPGTTGAIQPPGAAIEQQEMWHQVAGKVTNVDRKNGLVTLRSGPKTMLLMQFPRDSLRDVKVGDTLTTSMTVAKASSGQTARAYDVPKGPAERLMGQHQVTGTISSIDHHSGLLTVKNDNRTTMRLQFPPASAPPSRYTQAFGDGCG